MLMATRNLRFRVAINLATSPPTRFYPKSGVKKISKVLEQKGFKMSNETTSQTPKRNRGGRPCKLDSEFRGYNIKVGLNDFEYRKLVERAESVGLGSPRMRSEFVRKLILNSKINSVPMINKSALAQLNKIGNNLNQLARLANSNSPINTAQIAQIAQIHADINTIG